MLRIYDRLPQSLKEEERIEGGSVLSGLEPSLDENILVISQARIYWPLLGTVDFPEARLDPQLLDLIPGDYILGLGFTPGSDTTKLTVTEQVCSDYAVELRSLFLDPQFRVENLYVEDEESVFSPGFANAELKVSGEGLTSLKLQTDYDVVYDAVTYSPSDGFVTIDVEGPSVTLTLPDEQTVVKNLYVSGELAFRDGRSLGSTGTVSLFFQPVGRELLEEIPEERINIGLINCSRNRSFKILRKFHYATANFDITRYLTEFWDKELDKVYQTLFFYILDYLNPFTAYKKEYE